MKLFDYADLSEKRSWDYSEKGVTPEVDGINPIIETEKKISMGDLLIINDIAYRICAMSGRANKYNVAYVERLKEQGIFINSEEPEEKDYTHQITCPYCGYEDSDSWEEYDENDEYKCLGCGSTFSYQRNVTVEYCSQPVKRADVIKIN